MRQLAFLAGFLFLAATSFVGAQTPLSNVISKVRAQALHLPAEVNVVVLSPSDKAFSRTEYVVHRTFAANGSFQVDWANSAIQAHQEFRSDGTLIRSVSTDKTKNVTITMQTSPNRDSVRSIIEEKGKLKSDKTSALKPSMPLREELQPLFLQSWAAGVRDGLKFQTLSPDGGMVGDFQMKFIQTSDPMSVNSQYDFPAEFRKAFEGKGPFVVVDMSLVGVAAVFYPHHFYVVYSLTSGGPEWVAYFGEDPKAPAYQYAK